MSFRITAAIFIGAIIAIISIAQTPLSWKGKIVKEGDVTVVINPKNPVYESGLMTIKEELSIGGENVPYEEALSLIVDISVGPDGRIYVADFDSSEIKIFDKSGKFLRTFGRKGQGPGEFLLLTEMSYCISPNGLFVHDRFRGSYFDPDGNFKRSLPYHSNFYSVKADIKGNLRGLVEVRGKKGFGAELRLLDEHGNLGSSLARTPKRDMNTEDPYMPIMTWCIRRDGSIVEGYPEAYEFHIHNPDGKTVRRIIKDYSPVEVTAADRDAYTKLTMPGINKITFKFSRYHSAFKELFSDEKGWIFASTWEKDPETNLFLVDIFNQDGLYLGKVGWPDGARIINGGKLYTNERDSGEYPIIKRYALIWNKDIR